MKKQPANTPSLSEVHASVGVERKGFLRKLLAFSGPAFMVSVGYMDPGNWATDIAGGSQFGYKLIWVLLMSNMMAVLLQTLSARLGLVKGLDLAQASRASYPRFINFILWFFAEIAIAATDLAEVLGMAIGLQLLFDIPLTIGVAITVFDTFLLLILQSYGIRKMEAFILGLISIIGLAFLAEMFFARPDVAELVKGFVPSLPRDSEGEVTTSLYIAIGIIGATVMPHNLYLHSALVQTRNFEKSEKGIWEAIKFNFIDSVVALNLAFFVNAAILILAASTFYKSGMYDVSEIQDAHRFLEPILGTGLAPILFAVALIAAGQSSTITGTLAGQVVMEGYLNLRIQPWLRRLLTRLIAIVPAFLTLTILGEGSTGALLVLSQVILSLQLGFAIIPLIHFTGDKEKMGTFAVSTKMKALAWISAAIIVSLNVKLVIDTIGEWVSISDNALALWLTVVPVAAGAGVLLLYITFKPFLVKARKEKTHVPHAVMQPLDIQVQPNYKRIAIAVDFSDMDSPAISHAISQGGKQAEYMLIHIVETAGATVMGSQIGDHETESDELSLLEYKKKLEEQGLTISYRLGFGSPKKAIPEIVNEYNSDLLVMGAHGHRVLKDIILGTTVESVRHNVKCPVLIVRK